MAGEFEIGRIIYISIRPSEKLNSNVNRDESKLNEYRETFL